MKLKRMLSILLALALGLALVIPAFAEAVEGGPYAPIITKEPDFPDIFYIGDILVLDVEAKLPDSVDGELSYAWYDTWTNDWDDFQKRNVPIATGASIEQKIPFDTDSLIGVVVTNTYTDEHGEIQTAHTRLVKHFEPEPKSKWWLYVLGALWLPIALLLFPITLFGPLGVAFLAPIVLPVLTFLQASDWVFNLFGLKR